MNLPVPAEHVVPTDDRTKTLRTGGGKRRVQLDFTPETYEELVRLKSISGATTNADLIRAALRFYGWALAKQRDGWEIQLSRSGERVSVALVG